MSRSRDITNEFVHKAENAEQKKRRERKTILKKEFRAAAAASAAKFFGSRSPHVDIINEKENCTRNIVRGLMELSEPQAFGGALENFLNTVTLEGGQLKKGSQIARAISSCNPGIKEGLSVAAMELLMATEDERLVRDFVAAVLKSEPDRMMVIIDGANRLAGIDYIHTLKACAEGFLKNPGETVEILEKVAASIGMRPSSPDVKSGNLLFSDMVVLEVVKERLGA